MSLTPNEAADALRDIEQTGRRSGVAFGYRYAAPYFILWGAVWVVGYAANDIFPRQSQWLWAAGVGVGALGSALLGRLRPTRSDRSGLQALALVAIVSLYIAATYAILWPVGYRQQAAFVPLLAGAIYSGVGVFSGARWLVAGLGMIACTLVGFFFVHSHLPLYMAAVGGGGLILAGLWMRSA